ncbi:MAG: Hpt domain-containing protein, partial [Longimicrobiales bacterium]
MATLHDYFVEEVGEHLGRLEEALERGESSNREQLHRAARALRGTAQIAREDAAFRAANVLESATRALLDGRLQLDAATIDRLRASAQDLRAIARGADDDARADTIVARWAAIGIDARARDRPGSVAQETRAFLEFAAREVDGIVTELDHSLTALTDEPMDRESLKAVLRRQRALLGSARLQEIPVLAETLRAVEDLTSVIAKLDVAVRNEWLDVFRCARDVLKSAAALLETGHQPEPSTALSRLRVLRQELLERHGAGEAVSAVPGADGLPQPEVRAHADTATTPEAAPSADATPLPEAAPSPEARPSHAAAVDVP